MTRDELELKLSMFYLLFDQINEMDSRKLFLTKGTVVEPSTNFFLESEDEKAVYYLYLKNIIIQLRAFLNENIEEDYVKVTLEFINKEEMKSMYGISYALSIMENNLEIANIQYRGTNFFEYAEMAIYDPIQRIVGFLYKTVFGKSYKPEYASLL